MIFYLHDLHEQQIVTKKLRTEKINKIKVCEYVEQCHHRLMETFYFTIRKINDINYYVSVVHETCLQCIFPKINAHKWPFLKFVFLDKHYHTYISEYGNNVAYFW